MKLSEACERKLRGHGWEDETLRLYGLLMRQRLECAAGRGVDELEQPPSARFCEWENMWGILH